MHKGGWRPFWAALGAALLVLLPLVGGTVLLTRRMLHTQLLAQTAEPQQGVPITLPKEDDRMTVLLCTAGEQPGFLLLYLNAPQNVCGLLGRAGGADRALRGWGSVPHPLLRGGGPGRGAAKPCWKRWPCRRIPFIWLFPPPCWKSWRPATGPCGWGSPGHSPPKSWPPSARPGNVQTLSAGEASAFLTGLDEAGRIPPAHRAAARAAVWDAFFRQDLELLPASLPDALRAQSSALLTDFTAQDYARLGEILEFLANRAAPIRADALPGAWDRASGTYSVTEASRAAVQTFLNVSPTDEQASSASEP